MSKLPNLPDASDQEVVTRAREGDEDAYREMLRRYGPPVFELIHGMVGQRELAEDLAQETFDKAFRALDRHDPERKPSAWILRIANNTALKRAMRRLRPTHRRCFVLHYVEERSYDEIADIMNVPRGTVGTYLSRARAELKRMLEPAAGLSG